MPTVSAPATFTIPRYSESSRLRSPRDSDDVSRIHLKDKVVAEQVKVTHQAVMSSVRKLEKLRRRVIGGGGLTSKFAWKVPKELDPLTDFVQQDTFVFISPQNDLAITGLTDLYTSTLKTAPPGIWQAAQDVPASNGTTYNVPQLPYPGATGTSDLDGTNVYWIFWGGYPNCV